MAIRNSIYRYWASILFALPLGVGSVCSYAEQNSSSPMECAASPEYISRLQNFFSSQKGPQDYSCLTNYPSIAKNIKNYQLVDVRKNTDASIVDAWVIPVDELKLKSFLSNRPLLLLSEGFSRAEQATACATLKKAGFTSVKILIGGLPQWKTVTSKNPLQTIQTVQANDVIHEYFNGRVSIVAATESISAELKEIGFSEHRVLPSNTFPLLADIVITSSNGGYDPVVYIGSPDDFNQLEFNQQLTNLYILQGGISSLITQLRRDQLIGLSRDKPQEIPFCAQR